MASVDHKSKQFQVVRGLNAVANSLNEALKEVPVYILSEQTRKDAYAIISCIMNHKSDPDFPAEQVRTLANNFRKAIEERNSKEVKLLQNEAKEITSVWSKPTGIIIGS
jgi:hypothetical protein